MVKVGDRVESINFGWMEVVSEPYNSGTKRKDTKVDVRFDNTGTVRKGVLTRQFLLGAVRDGTVEIKPWVGMRFKSGRHGFAEILNYENSKKITIRFLDTGNIQTIQLDNLLTGLFADVAIKKEYSEEVFAREQERKAAYQQEVERKEKRKAEVMAKRQQRKDVARKRREEEYQRSLAHKLRVENLEQEYKRNLETILIPKLNKEVDLSKPSKGVLDIDFKDRDGNWVLRFNHDGEFVQTRLGKLHNNMTQRPNQGGKLQNQHNTSYKGVSVSEEFEDPQKFCEWVVKQPGWVTDIIWTRICL